MLSQYKNIDQILNAKKSLSAQRLPQIKTNNINLVGQNTVTFNNDIINTKNN